METVWKVIVFVACSYTTIWEIRNDRYGEKRKDKAKDFYIVSAMTIVLAGLVWWLLWITPDKTIAAVLGWRVLIFDYIITRVLYKRGVIEGEDASKWWKYMGESTHWWDQLIAKVPWQLRIIGRLIIFSTALWLNISY
jgi:hypothetical protein